MENVNKKRIKVTDIICLLLVFAVFLSVIIWCAVPTISIGSDVDKSSSLNVFSFIYFDDDSLVNQFVDFVNELDGLTDDTAILSEAVFLVQAMFLIVVILTVLIQIIVYAIKSLVNFFKHKSELLAHNAISITGCVIFLYVAYGFFGSVSGGTGEYSYYVGYTVDIKTTIVIIASILTLFTISLINGIKGRAVVFNGDNLYKWIIALLGFLGCFAICIACTDMKLFPVFSYTLSSGFTGIVSSIMYSFNISTLVFPVLNLFVLYAAFSLYNRAVRRGKVYLFYLMTAHKCGTVEYDLLKGKKLKLMNKKRTWLAFLYDVILSALTVFAVSILLYSTLGLGWSVDIMPDFVAILICSAIIFVAMLITKIVFKARNKNKEVQELQPAAVN